MDDRNNLLALHSGGSFSRIPIWLMGFDIEETPRELISSKSLPANLSPIPYRKNYPWDRITDDERTRTLAFNTAIMKPATGIGWGANMSLGQGGAGEFHYYLVDANDRECTLQSDTGSKRIIRCPSHTYHDFDLPLTSAAQYEQLRLPDPTDPRRYRGVEEDVTFFRNAGSLTYANVNGFFSVIPHHVMDYQQFLIDLVHDTDNARRLIDAIGAWNICATRELLERGIDCIVTCDDLGFADNLLISPAHYKELIYPWHRRLCDIVHDYDALVHFHCHGNLNRILPLIVSAGFDMLNPFDRFEGMDLVAFLREYREHGTIPVGGLHKFFFQWDRNTQREYLTTLFTNARDAGGRWIFMDTGGIPEDIDANTFSFLLDALHELQYLVP